MEYYHIFDIIPELLYKHNCVIVPDFGGFIANFKQTGFEEDRNLIHPSCKKVAYNRSLSENDGLLVNAWANAKNIDYNTALNQVMDFSNQISEMLVNNKSLEFKNIGTFYLTQEKTILFIPYFGLNFLESSYGLPPVKVKPIALVNKEHTPVQPKEVEKIEQHIIEKSNFQIGHWFKKIAASFTILAILGSGIAFLLKNQKQNNTVQQKNQTAAIAHIDTESIISKPKNNIVSQKTFQYNLETEKSKMLALQQLVASHQKSSIQKTETYYINIAKAKTQAEANIILNQISNICSDAIIESSNGSYFVNSSEFYNRKSASIFLNIIKKQGFAKSKILTIQKININK